MSELCLYFHSGRPIVCTCCEEEQVLAVVGEGEILAYLCPRCDEGAVDLITATS